MPSKRSLFYSRWDLLALAGLLLLIGFYRWILPQLPDPVPTHYDGAGLVNGWTPKAQLPYILFGVPLGVWVLIASISSLSALFQEDPAKARLMAALPMRGCLGLGMAILMGSVLGIPLWGPRSVIVGVVSLLLSLAFGVAMLVVQAKKQFGAASIAGYKWGLFYHNAEDPRVWVPKCPGVGWTLNFAKPAAWWWMIFFLSIGIVPLAVIFFHAH